MWKLRHELFHSRETKRRRRSRFRMLLSSSSSATRASAASRSAAARAAACQRPRAGRAMRWKGEGEACERGEQAGGVASLFGCEAGSPQLVQAGEQPLELPRGSHLPRVELLG